ncbi:MAG: hypothetical protein DRQ51_10410 [Gammaproteobacteria bacterium]|nr:MAG: hypothetical protein DRQ51_10410 [Gammaproteobacteria bacterium]
MLKIIKNKVVLLASITVVVFGIGFFVITQQPQQINTTTKPTSINTKQQKITEIIEKKIEQDQLREEKILKKEMEDGIAEMEEILNNKPQIPPEHKNAEQDYIETQKLITKVEQITGKSFEFDIEQQQIDPATQPELYEIQQNFDKLEQEMQEIVQDMQ